MKKEFSFPKEKELPGKAIKLNRENKKLNLEEIAKHLRIKKEYLLAIENDEYDQLPSGLYGRHFLKKYCQFLKINYRKTLKASPLSEIETSKDPFSQKILKSWNLLVFPKIIRNLVLLVIFLSFVFYLLFYFRNLSAPPKLIIEQPATNLVINKNNLEIKGLSNPETEIIINGNSIISDSKGNFSYEIRLKNGLNNINIIAKKKHGQETFVQRQILVEQSYE